MAIPDLLVQYGLAVLFTWAFAVQAGLPAPAVPLLLGAGALSGSGQMNLALAVGVAMAATLGADVLWYMLGRSQGTRVLGTLCRFSLDPDSLVRDAKERFLVHRARYLILAKFLPGVNPLADDARRVFARIGGDAEALVRQVEQSLQGEHRPRPADLIVRGTHRLAPIVWIGIGLAAFQQFVGINIIFYYGEVLWKAAGATEQWALRINLLTGLVNILATIPAIALIDHAGRKPLLLAGSAGMAVTLGAMAVVFATAGVGASGRPLLSSTAAVTGLAAANLYIIAFAISWGPVMWVLLGEMFPNRMRGAALAVSGATNWVCNFAVTVTFLPLSHAAGLAGAYALYAVAAALSLPFVWAAVRETRGKTLEQM